MCVKPFKRDGYLLGAGVGGRTAWWAPYPLWFRRAASKPQQTRAGQILTGGSLARGFGIGFWLQCLDLSGSPEEETVSLAASSETQRLWGMMS